MRFEILGELTDVETFATGPESAKSLVCGESMDAAVGENARE
jgi:hypothetical protein